MTTKAEMAKEENIWDDSVLIKAFEDAVSVYKKMHKMGNSQSPGGGVEGFVSSAEKNANAGAEERATVVRMPKGNRSKSKAAKTENLAPAESYRDLLPAQDNRGIMYGSEEYNMLLSQYYELEQKRAKILEQLYGSWSYQYSVESAQDYATTANQADHRIPARATSGYFFPVWQCTACSGSCTCGAEMPPTSVDDDTGMAAAQNAISSLRINADEWNVKTEVDEHEAAPVMISSKNLSASLSAWYSAGFYTGKFHAEQSLSKKTNL